MEGNGDGDGKRFTVTFPGAELFVRVDLRLEAELHAHDAGASSPLLRVRKVYDLDPVAHSTLHSRREKTCCRLLQRPTLFWYSEVSETVAVLIRNPPMH